MTAFFDIAEKQAYIFDGKTGRLSEKIPFEVKDGFGIEIGPLPPGIEDAYVSLPLDSLNFRVLDLPLADMGKIREVLPFELEGIILGEPSSYAIDAAVLSGLNGGKRVLAVYVNKPVIKALLDGFKKIGIDPKAVTSIDLCRAIEAADSVDELGQMLLKDRLAEGDERTALALREISHETVNLRTGEFSYTRETEKARRSLKITAAMALLLAVLFSADMIVRTVALKKEASSAKSEILRAYTGAFPSEKPQGTEGLTLKLKSHIKEIKDREALLKGVSPLDFLLRLRGLNVKLALTDITLDGDSVMLRGEASSLSEVQEIKAKLEGILSEAAISDTGQSAKGKVVFTLTGKEKG